MSKGIPLTQGYVAIVDDEDYEELVKHKWYVSPAPNGNRAARSMNPGTIYMHRAIMNASDGIDVDHRDHDMLNNQRSNLRLCTRTQNLGNTRKKAGCTSKFKGVHLHKACGLWCARIKIDYRYRQLGYYRNERDAARAYNKAAKKHFGEFAWLNDL